MINNGINNSNYIYHLKDTVLETKDFQTIQYLQNLGLASSYHLCNKVKIVGIFEWYQLSTVDILNISLLENIKLEDWLFHKKSTGEIIKISKRRVY